MLVIFHVKRNPYKERNQKNHRKHAYTLIRFPINTDASADVSPMTQKPTTNGLVADATADVKYLPGAKNHPFYT